MLVLFLGRSTDGILKDTKREFPDEKEVIVVSRDGDKLEAPEGLKVATVSEFTADTTKTYTIISNGGTSAQLLPVVKKLVEASASFSAYDLQRDGVQKVW